MKKKNRQEFIERAKALISEMTLSEKLGMLTTHHFAVERLGIKEYYIGAEVARGFVGRSRDKFSTVFPQPVGLAGTFNTELMSKLGEIAANEARAYYNEEDQKGGAALWGPTVDMARDPRWGRNEEEYGEDPCLTGEMAAAYTKAMLGDDGRYVKSVPTLKHFCADNNEEDRGSCNAFLPLRLKYEYYYKPFEIAIRDGGAKSVMAAYNEINGCPGIMNPELQTLLKDKWGMWYTVSDGGDFIQTLTLHRFCETNSRSLKLSLEAGSDSMTDNADVVRAAAERALENGELTENDIDKTLLNTLFSRFALGQFDDDCDHNRIGTDIVDNDGYKEINLRAALEQVTLLKNNGILPFSGSCGKIAVLGALADENIMDWYTGYSSGDISIKKAMEDSFGTDNIVFDSLWDIVSIKAPNGKYLSADENGNVAAVADTAGENELFELRSWGENWNTLYSVKYGRYIRLFDDNTFKLHNGTIYDWFTKETLNFKEYGGKQLIEEFLHHRRMVCKKDGTLTVEKLTGVKNDQLFEIIIESCGEKRAEQIARECDRAVYCCGNHPLQVAKECYDRKTLELNIRKGMAEVISRANKNTVMVLVSSYPYSINEENQKVPAIIYTSHAGAHLGTAVAKVLTGEYNPAGRLCQTWYKSEHDLPDILDYDIESAKTTYMYFEGEPLYPFGFGLSYSAFEYSDISAEKKGDDIYITLKVKNTSKRSGDEVVQIYFRAPYSKVSRPIKKLCGFTRVHIGAGKEKTVRIRVKDDILKIYDVRSGEMLLESGRYEFMAGASSADIRLRTRLTISGGKLAMRRQMFSADSYDSADNFKIFYSEKLCRHYIRVMGWSATAVYDSVPLKNAKKLILAVSSLISKAQVQVSLGGRDHIIETAPSNAYDDFDEYTIVLDGDTDIKKDTLVLSSSEGVGILDIRFE